MTRMNAAKLQEGIDTQIQWAALHHAGYRDQPDLAFLVNALTNPDVGIWSYAQRILRRILPMASLVERWQSFPTRTGAISSRLPDWIHTRCDNWGPNHEFVVICAELLAAADEIHKPLIMERLAPFFGAGRVITERLDAAGHHELAVRFQDTRFAFMEKQFPKQLTVIPTMACQLKCRYCYSAGLPQTTSNTMTKDELVQLLDWSHQAGVTRICLAGGEPTLYPYLDTLIEFASAHGMEYFLSTNGLFPHKVLDLILATPPLSVSLHINPEIYQTRKRRQFVDNAQALASSGMITALRFNLISAAADEYVNYLDLCEEIGVRQIRLAVPVPNFSRSNTFVNLNAGLQTFAHTIDQFVSTGRQRKIEVLLSKPFPLCLLAEETVGIFLENGSYNACCQVHLQRNTQNLTVYPDMHFSPCLSLNRPSAESIMSYPDMFQAAASFKEELDNLSRIPLMDQCRSCPLSIGGRCIGACFSYRVGSNATLDSGDKWLR